MNKATLKAIASVILFLLALTCANVPRGLATTTGNSHFPSPEDVITEPLNATYFNTTNPYAQISGNEVNEAEGNYPIYALAFVDEEEQEWSDWKEYATLQLERGDESLVNFYSVDVRILGFETWSSDDSITHFDELTDEFCAEKSDWLHQWYDGVYWHNYVDLIVGITAQLTPDDPYLVYGQASTPEMIDERKAVITLRWTIYWKDDNVVQHELSHLFYAIDHKDNCCAMAEHTHYQDIILEDGMFFPVFHDELCALTTYIWCSDCYNIINAYKALFGDNSNMLTIRHDYPYDPKCTFTIIFDCISEPIDPGIYTFAEPISVTIGFTDVASSYHFAYWSVNGTQKVFTTTIIYTSGKHSIAAYFEPDNPSSPYYPSGPGAGRWARPYQY